MPYKAVFLAGEHTLAGTAAGVRAAPALHSRGPADTPVRYQGRGTQGRDPNYAPPTEGVPTTSQGRGDLTAPKGIKLRNM